MSKLGLSITEASEALGISRTTMYELIGRGEVESVKIGRRRVVPADAVEAFMRRLVEVQRAKAAA